MVNSFYGTLYTLEDEYSGTFSLSEREGGIMDISINGYSISQRDKGYSLIKATIETVKSTTVE